MTYTLQGAELVSEARLEVLQAKLPAARGLEYITFGKDLEANIGVWIDLEETGPADKATSAAKGGEDQRAGIAGGGSAALPRGSVVVDARAQQLIEDVRALIKSNQIPQAQAKLDEARALNPEQPGLWFFTAVLAGHQRHYKEAEADLRKDTSEDPEWRYAVLSYLLTLQAQQEENSLAIDTLNSMRKLHPEKPELVRREAALLSTEKRFEEAISLLEGVALRNPSDKYTMLALGNTQFAAGRLKEGQVTLETTLEGTADPEILNDAACTLVDHQMDLSSAAADAQKALTLLEKQTAAAQPGALDAKDLGRQRLLGAVWDTIGWIDYLQGDLASAEEYIHAAWLNSEHAEVGYHLGMLYEKQGKPQQALEIYTLADGAHAETETPSPMIESLRKHRGALIAKGLKDSSGRESSTRLADLRSIHLPLLTKQHEEADFMVSATANGVAQVNFVDGSGLLRGQTEALRKAFSTDRATLVLPKGSSAQLIRRGILSCSPVIGKCDFTFFLPQDTQLPKPAAGALAQAAQVPAPE